MRVSTSQIYDLGSGAITRIQDQLLQTQQHVATGKAILTPSEDPVASAQAQTVQQSKDRLGQFSANLGVAKDALALNDSVLAQVTSVVQQLQTLAVNGGNGTLNDTDRASLATEAAGQLQSLIGLANSKDGNGNYLFAGFAVTTQPFAATSATTVGYNGDQGTRTMQVGPARALPIGIDGSSLFEKIRNGNGQFSASAAATNTGTGLVTQGTVTSPGSLPGDSYRLVFNVAGTTTTYDVLDVTLGTTVSAGNAFTAGSAINVGGMQVSIAGAPANGDRFDLAPSTSQSLFATVQGLVDALKTPTSSPAGLAAMQNGVNSALANLGQALDHVLTVRAGFGASLNEADTLDSGNSAQSLQLDQTLSKLTDLDYNKALSDFARQQIALEAAQKSFAKVSGLSLFAYL